MNTTESHTVNDPLASVDETDAPAEQAPGERRRKSWLWKLLRPTK
ncbi:MAG: hypothetical protein ACREEM_24475 [Blastocatellia bacterium]